MRSDDLIARIGAGLMLALMLWAGTAAAGAHQTVAATASNIQMKPPVQATHPPTWGLHGMVLFGGADGLFASHLPMFHASHDYHVVIALQLASPELDAALRARLAKNPELWTLVPEEFELARLAPGAANPLTTFKADIVEGHFERGGKTMYSGVIVRVMHTDRFAQLDAGAGPPTIASYQPIGQGHTWFLVKEIRARPDFDHVVMLSSTSRPSPIDVQVIGTSRPDDAVLKAMLPLQTRIVGTVYFDTEDLQ
ncbi:MAG TPA: hypothetical protein VK660_10150 [Xanthomonadaceae bacterium]|jgi:hypothetical protein|nr:hypothetical protein [Xanthomonadaceae bacterium]